MEVLEQKTVRAYSIFDIKEWQTELQENLEINPHLTGDELISLPTLQRGFVWKHYQIEALWDSILRGYPIGALLLSKTGNRKDLLDGQQRCTSIALGFQNPFEDEKSVLNLKKNIPSIWMDLQPLESNKYGLKMGIRVLTRSHPWGYQLADHRKPLTTNQRESALNYFRRRTGDPELKFSKLENRYRVPWDSYFPIPLYMLLNADTSTFEDWRDDVWHQISKELHNIETRHGPVNYSKIEEPWLHQTYLSVLAAKQLVLPEIPVKSTIITQGEDLPEDEENVTLFVRLNAEGTRISGEELIYSMLKAIFPEAKQLVEEIDLRFLAPSKLVNLFIRLTLILQSKGNSYYRDVSLTAFRNHLKDESFKTRLTEFISYGDAKILTKKANEILSEGPHSLPGVFTKDMISGTPDLFLVLLIYAYHNNEPSEAEKAAIRTTFLQVFLFGKKKDKVAAGLYNLLIENKFSNWEKCAKKIIAQEPDHILHLIEPADFEDLLLKRLMPLYVQKKTYPLDYELNRNLVGKDQELIKKLVIHQTVQDLNEEEKKQLEVAKATDYWIDLLNRLLWNKHLLVICQREYFKAEFKEYMEFEGIEDTNRPWDWDHIYPNSWVKSRHNISQRVKALVNTNGNYRALSFNTNRSESNHQSPYTRFHGNDPEKKKYRKASFIKENDLLHWLELTDSDKRLKDENSEKVKEFIKAVLTRISNIYKECYEVIHIQKE
ncbi:DUF262 domain-containing protein [uncultured Salegentibacter sp.]|uniref:DUF262 domain-containing protein n=1 Tax=uncultured Salegentibacter sp. TaxID=259320 RepID=UPI0025987F41|nr:DUF262 domain-containing protein [uncultured Salegentibacter sp.]